MHPINLPLQHALSTAEVLHFGEDDAPLQAHIAELVALHNASTTFELALTHDLAFASWRRKRAWAVETEFASKFKYLCDAVLTREYRILHRDMLAAERLYNAALTRLTREVTRRMREKGPLPQASAPEPIREQTQRKPPARATQAQPTAEPRPARIRRTAESRHTTAPRHTAESQQTAEPQHTATNAAPRNAPQPVPKE